MVEQRAVPRMVIAGLGGGSGKTLVSLALLQAAGDAGLAVRAFKKGPDYIDANWLTWACGSPARNLDTYMMGVETVQASFARHAVIDGINVVEGNRGLFDGMDVHGTHSTAVLAKALRAPILLVLNVTKTTRTAAALVLGAQKFEPDVNIAGVVLNFVNGHRHEQIVRDSITSICGVPVVGAVPRMRLDSLMPERHLGLITPDEYTRGDDLKRHLAGEVARGLDIQAIVAIARNAGTFAAPAVAPPPTADGSGLKIGYIRDAAFSFYYECNLEALAASGAELVRISAIDSARLPVNLSALYIGGGFPEIHASTLAANKSFLQSLASATKHGMPIYAECGGLMLLSRNITWKGVTHAMSGVLPFDCELTDTAQGHGYVELLVDRENPFFDEGTVIRGHEFHYSKPVFSEWLPATVCRVRRGKGMGSDRDAVGWGNIWAAYTHVHALATPEWAAGIIRAALRYRSATAAHA